MCMNLVIANLFDLSQWKQTLRHIIYTTLAVLKSLLLLITLILISTINDP